MNTLAVMCMAFTSTSPSRTPDFSTARVTSRVMLTNARRSGISSARYSVWLFMAGHRSTARAGVAGACKSPAAGDAPRIDRPPFAAPRCLSLPATGASVPHLNPTHARGSPPATERPGEPPSASSTTFDARSKTLSSNGLPDIVILSGARTPMAEWVGGKRGDGQNGGALAGVSAIDLGASAARAALDRADVLPGMLDHVVMGNALQTSADAIYGARHVGLKAGVSDECPALTVNRLCGSGFQSVASAAQLLQLGEAQWVLAGGLENMSQAPHVLRGARGGGKLGPGAAAAESLVVGWEGRRGREARGAARAARGAGRRQARPRPRARGLAVRGVEGQLLRALHGADERQPRPQVRDHAPAAGRVRAPLARPREQGQQQRPVRAGDRAGRGEAGQEGRPGREG